MDDKKIKSVIGDDSDLICIKCKKEKKMRMSAYCKNCHKKLKQAAEAWATKDYKRPSMEVLAFNTERYLSQHYYTIKKDKKTGQTKKIDFLKK